jgi:predicted nucleic acid-binding protein
MCSPLALCAPSRHRAEFLPPGKMDSFFWSSPSISALNESIPFEEPYFAARLSRAQRRANLTLVREEAAVVPITVRIQGVASHPEDDLILATALSAKADYLVTGDRKLQALKTYRGVRIVSPQGFLEIFPLLSLTRRIFDTGHLSTPVSSPHFSLAAGQES